MGSRSTISVLLSWQLPAILAQQACYWPSGKHAALVSCFSSQASTCCTEGEICMSNGLCIGGTNGLPYRGGCTDKNWSNTTACPDWCNDHYPDNSANIYRCPCTDWVYCDLSLSSPCQSGTTGLVNYTSAKLLGAPLISSTKNVITPSSPIVTTFTSVTESTASVTLTNQPTCTDIVHQSSLPATAIGVGLGIPFGIAAIGFLIFLFWRDARRKNARGPKQDISQDKRTIRHKTLAGGEMDGNGLRPELQGTMMNPELYGSEMIQ